MSVWKNLLALTLGVLFVGLLEGTLALLGVHPLADEDPFVGFAGSQPLFVRDPARGGAYQLNPAKATAFNPQSFAMPKPKGTFRIVAFGGSTTYGHPYIGRTAFPAWLALLLQTADPGRTYEAINAGGISYASYRVRRLVEEMAAYEPDLFIVYSGHNEFLEKRNFEAIIHERPALRRLRSMLHRSRLYTAVYRSIRALKGSGAERTTLGDSLEVTLEQIGGPNLYHRDDVFRRGVIEEYRLNIRAIARFARQRGIPLVLCTVSSNLSGVSPFKSEHRPGLSPAQTAEWDARFSQAGEAFDAGEHARALELLELAAAIDDRVALLHFARGQVLHALGREGESREAFVRAKEEDIIPLRALEEFNTIVREVAREERVPLADVDARFRQLSPAGITGPPLFIDHVHPDIEGQQLLALTVLDAAVGASVVPLMSERWAAARGVAEQRLQQERAALPPRYLAMGQWVVGRTFYWAGKLREALEPLEAAWKTVRDIEEIPAMIGTIELERGDLAEAERHLSEARRLNPLDVPAAVGLARVQIARGDGTAALAVLKGLAPGEHAALFHLAFGEALLLTGERNAALEHLEEAAKLGGRQEKFLAALCRGQLLGGSEAAARGTFREILALRGSAWDDSAWSEFRDRQFR